MKKILCLATVIILTGSLVSCGGRGVQEDRGIYERLKEGFADPSGTARPKVYWWWLNGYTDTARMKVELQAMKDAGIGGVDIFEIGARPEGLVPAGPPFMSEKSLEHIAFAIREAGRLGLEVGLNLSSSWNAGGSWIGPQHSAKTLYRSHRRLSGDGTVQDGLDNDPSRSSKTEREGKIKEGSATRLPFPEVPRTDSRGRPLLIEFAPDGKPVYRQEIAVLAVPVHEEGASLDTARILNVSRFFDPDTELLNWSPPEGEWDIYRYVCSSSGEALKLPSPNSMGPIIDHFDSTATRVHFMYFINKLKPLLGDIRESGLKNLYLASFEATGTVWTPSMAEAFREIHGYDLYKFLPWFFDKDAFGQAGAEFERDFDLAVSELMINNHYRKGSEIARSYGLNLISESGGPGPPLHNVPVEAIKALGALDIPRGEFWMPSHRRFDGSPDSIDLLMLVKEIAAASHIYGSGIAELEAFTSFQNWQEGPGDMKPVGDRAFCEGMSRAVIHGFTHNPEGTGYPGITYGAGTHYNDKTTWWKKSKPFNDYLARISYIFQETDFTADVLYYYGDKTPNFATPKNTRFAVGSGYDYEIINTEILLRDVEVRDGKLVLPDGREFSILSFGEVTGNIPGVWEKLRELAMDGAIITGAAPDKLPDALPAASWVVSDQTSFGKDELDAARGKILSGVPALSLLKAIGIGPDFDYTDKGTTRLDFQHSEVPFLDYIHYRKDDIDFYFVRNTSGQWLSRECSFRQKDKFPELWDPVSGAVVPISIYEQDGQHIRLPLTLPPYGSCFVVFSGAAKRIEPHYKRIISDGPHPPLLTYKADGVEIFKEGTYELLYEGGKKKIVNEPEKLQVKAEWLLTFPEGWGAPDSVEFPELTSWTKSKVDGIRYFSGTATYMKAFDVPANFDLTDSQRVYLDLGRVSEVAEVWLNGEAIGISWTPPYRFDITGIVKTGKNSLKIEVVNNWSNRLTGDARTGKEFTRTNMSKVSSHGVPWADTPLMESGLLGPVTIQTYSVIP